MNGAMVFPLAYLGLCAIVFGVLFIGIRRDVALARKAKQRSGRHRAIANG